VLGWGGRWRAELKGQDLEVLCVADHAGYDRPYRDAP
jgi:hypothetical protein